jgi:hypothetical protein
MVAQVGYSVVGRSGGRVTSCAVCTVHVETRSASFLVEPQNKGQRFVSGLPSKPLRWFVSDLASKPLERFLPVWPQNWWLGFPGLLQSNFEIAPRILVPGRLPAHGSFFDSLVPGMVPQPNFISRIVLT